MIKSKIIDVLRCLSPEELKKLSDYLNSPIFNKRKLISDLYEIYKNNYPDFENKNFTKEKVFSKLFPGKKYNDENFRNLNSILFKLTEDFLSFINYSRNPLTLKRHLLSEINHKRILTVFEKNFEESKKVLYESHGKDLDYFFDEYDLFLKKDLYNSIINKFSKEDIMKSEKNLICFFVMKLLEIHCYILYECRILGMDKILYVNDSFADELLKRIPVEISTLPQVQIYYNAFKLEQTNNIKYYDKLKQLLSNFGNLINKEKHYNNYVLMIEFIKRKYSSRDIKTTAELFQLRKEIVDKNLMMEKVITNIFYWNLVKSGTRGGEFEWTYKFINNYENYLIPKYREITKELCLGQYYFEKKEFRNALSHSAKVKYEDNFYNLEVKNLTSKIYFETGQYESLISLISSYRMYLSKNRTLSKKDSDAHVLFLNFLDKLLRIREQKKFYKLGSLITQIRENEFAYDYWVLEKAKDMYENVF